MPYLLDANTFIQGKNEYYGFAICPGFWEWLDYENARANVFSIDRIGAELEAGRDELATWAKQRRDSFFLPLDQEAHAAMTTVSAAVLDGDFKDHAKRLFLGSADPFLIAYALAHGHTVATHEVHIDGERRKVKIPTICAVLGVPSVRTFPMLADLGARFVLERRS